MSDQSLEIKRGEIYLIDLPQIEGNIQYGRRPCVISSTSVNNKYSSLLNVIPLTSKLRKVYPMHVLVGVECGLNTPSYALTEQLMPVMKDRVMYKLGECDELTMKRVEEGIKIQQGMNQNKNQQSQNNGFEIMTARQMAQAIFELEKFILTYGMNAEIVQSIQLQTELLTAYCRKFNEDINKYYQSRISHTNGGVKKYA